MKKCVLLLLVCFSIINGPALLAQKADAQAKAKSEILAAEKAFCKMTKDKGIEAAFLAFAADDAVMCRNKVYKGKEGIMAYYKNKDKNDKLTWKPDFVSVSESGDMGYTYGEYDFSGVRAGETLTDHGTFHTIWKKQKDCSWKFVVD